MARIKFEVVKAERPKETTNEGSGRQKKPVKSKYHILLKTLKQIDISDYVIVEKDVPPLNLVLRVYGVRKKLKDHMKTETHPKGREYEVHHLQDGDKYHVIVKRVQ